MDVSIIIVNYNTPEYVEGCVKSLYCQTKNIEYETIIVDNASEKKCVAFLVETAQKYGCKLILNSENLGFGAANNIGAIDAKGQYLFFLNSDTVLLNNAVELLFRYIVNAKERIACVGAFLEKADGQPNISFGCFPTSVSLLKYAIGSLFFSSIPMLKRIKKKLDLRRRVKRYKATTIVDYVCGADMMISKRLFVTLGGFDKSYFMYFEETQLQLNASRKGYANIVVYGPRILHYEGCSIAPLTSQNLYGKRELLFDVGMIKYAKKNAPKYVSIIVRYILNAKSMLPYYPSLKNR